MVSPNKLTRLTRTTSNFVVAYILGVTTVLVCHQFFIRLNTFHPCLKCDCPPCRTLRCNCGSSSSSNITKRWKEWPVASTVAGMASAASRVDRIEFAEMLKMGMALDGKDNGEDTLVFYSRDAWPQHHEDYLKETGGPIEMSSSGLPKLRPQNAVEACDYLNVAVIQKPEHRQCLAIMSHGRDESFHIQSFRRKNHTGPLLPVGKGVGGDDIDRHHIPRSDFTAYHRKMLRIFVENIDRVVAEVKRIADRIAQNNAIVAITTNQGYSHLLGNFACLSNARGVNISKVLVFATDPETEALAKDLGMASYYDEKMFASFPAEKGQFLGHISTSQMIYARMICLRILSMLGYNFLYQDVDVMWYKDPMDYFKTLEEDHDIYLMEDGARWRLYAPFNANAGFFYARNNPRTRNLFSSILNLAEHVFGMNDQALLNNLLSTHAAGFGLKPKVFSREDSTLFLGGFQYLSMPDMWRPIMNGTAEPYTFHAHWTKNSDLKEQWLRQMGLWHLEGVSGSNSTCSVEPLFRCYFRDLPSTKPCRESPSFREYEAPSFW